MATEPQLEIRPFVPTDEPAVVALWERCALLRPWNDPSRDIQRKLAVGAEFFLVGEIDSVIVATVMAGYEGHRGWLNYLAVDSAHQRRGLGRQMIKHAESLLLLAGCPKINLQIRSENQGVIDFYRSLGYVVDDVISLGKRLVKD